MSNKFEQIASFSRNDDEFIEFVLNNLNILQKENPDKGVNYILFLFRRKYENALKIQINKACSSLRLTM